MIYLSSSDLAIIHIPRTGGTALRDSLRYRSDAILYCSSPSDEHMTAQNASRLHPGCRTLSVMRSPWQIVASHWRFCQLLARTPQREQWAKSMAMFAALPFAVFVARLVETDWLNVGHCGGFGAWYCDRHTEIVQYSRDVNERVLSRLGVARRCERVNTTQSVPGPRWDAASIDRVGRYCRGDLERFSYRAPVIP